MAIKVNMSPKQGKKVQEEDDDAIYEVEEIVGHRRSTKNQVNFLPAMCAWILTQKKKILIVIFYVLEYG